jgi:hypothetical protein
MTVPTGAGRCRCKPSTLKRTPSASSAETTRCRARALALGTLSLDPSQAVRQGREIEARSASSCCDRPVRLRAARNMPPVISTNRHVEILYAASIRVNVSVLYQSFDTAGRSLPTRVALCGGNPSGRAARGSVAPRKMACRPARGGWHGKLGFKAINSRTGKGQPERCPFQSGAEMDAKTTHVLVLLAALSLVCTALAWAVDHAVFSSVFAALAAVAVLGIAPRPRR